MLRECDWSPWVVLEVEAWNRPHGPARLIDVAADPIEPVAVAIDIGTTTVSAYLVDLTTGEVLGSSAEYNGQIQCGEDVISRIIYAGRDGGLAELGQRVRQTIAELLERLQKRTGVAPTQIYKATVAGNTTMIHLFLGLPPASIRLAPYIPTVNMPGADPGPRDRAGHPPAGERRLPAGRRLLRRLRHHRRRPGLRPVGDRGADAVHRRRHERRDRARHA